MHSYGKIEIPLIWIGFTDSRLNKVKMNINSRLKVVVVDLELNLRFSDIDLELYLPDECFAYFFGKFEIKCHHNHHYT